MKNRAVFLDRDGTINQDLGDICSVDKLVFMPKAFESLRLLQKKFMLFIVTNQSGIGKKIFSEHDFIKFSEYYNTILVSESIDIKKLYYCPHPKEQKCVCRKPSPYFLKEAEKEFEISLEDSWVIGDHPHDIEMAHQSGTKSIYVLTGHGIKHKDDLALKPNFVRNHIYDAVNCIMEYEYG